MPFALRDKFLDDRIYRADQEVRRFEYLVRDTPGANRNALGSGSAIVCYLDSPDEEGQLQLIESIGRGLTQPLDLLGHCRVGFF